MRKVGVGGTFNALHRGHKALLDKAFLSGDEVVVGLTTDAFAAGRKEKVIPYEQRRTELEDYLRAKGRPWAVVPIDTPAGNTDQSSDVSVLVISPETLPGAVAINDARREKGLEPLELVMTPHVLAEDCVPISSGRIMSGEIDGEGRLLRPLVVNVGSDNRIKIDAVRNVLTKLYSSVEVRGVKVVTSVPEQPRGEQTRQGAMERARESIGPADFGIGLEAGVFDAPDGLYDVQYCAVIDKRGHYTVGHGSGFRYPPAVAERVNEGWTVGRSFRELYSWEKDGKKEGAISYLTNGVLKRTELAEQAVLAAMVPRIKRDLYPDL
ncbi:inosine/xanthosine triphosphatase [Methanomassiliicoccus luminyensis]|uniref:inosine/xanthosine triphosphatase n=1 Tax=Methanomassiliicoccus luminyensis TaxID=1080712 RepID=UPI00036DE175|nr:inosine/xanthosine triphosphatase [Methanomassiliicoccus luminyensis]